MDKHGIEMMVLSLNAPAIQGIPDPARANEIARKANDHLAEQVHKRPDRFQALAALPMQDPALAIRELERCVKDLGFRGALVNGFSQLEGDKTLYYDLPQYRPFWATVEKLTCRYTCIRAIRCRAMHRFMTGIHGCSVQFGHSARRPRCMRCGSWVPGCSTSIPTVDHSRPSRREFAVRHVAYRQCQWVDRGAQRLSGEETHPRLFRAPTSMSPRQAISTASPCWTQCWFWGLIASCFRSIGRRERRPCDGLV